MDAPAPPPDFSQTSQCLARLSAQVALVPNMPAVAGVQALQARLDQLFGQQAELRAELAAEQAELRAQLAAEQAQLAARQDRQHREVMGRLDGVTDGLNLLQEGQRQLSMRLHNAAASLDAPILYPLGMTDDGLPRTKQALLQIGAHHAINVSRALGLPALPPDSTLVSRRQQIIDYLGCGMIAT